MPCLFPDLSLFWNFVGCRELRAVGGWVQPQVGMEPLWGGFGAFLWAQGGFGGLGGAAAPRAGPIPADLCPACAASWFLEDFPGLVAGMVPAQAADGGHDIF